jgi:hypothetical protein
MLFKRNILLFGVLILCASIFAAPAFAGGVPHPVYGTVRTSTGEIPAVSKLTITAYITARPGEILSYPKDIPDIQYEAKSGIWQIEVSSLKDTWAVGEILHIDFYDTDSGKSSSRKVTLTTDAFQNADEVLLPIKLASFGGSYDKKKNAISLEWRSVSEYENTGWYVYRSDKEDGKFVRVSRTLIEGAGTVKEPRQYRYVDNTIDGNSEVYYYLLEDVDAAGRKARSFVIEVLVAKEELPKKYTLLRSYPNPCNPETWIPYLLPKDSIVTVSIYNLSGQLVRRLDLGERKAGRYVSKDKAAHWDGKNEAGEVVASGIYFYTLQISGKDAIATKKLLLLK